MSAIPYAQRRAALAAHLGPHGIAIIPTAPEHQGWREIQSMMATPSLSSGVSYSSTITPSESPEPRTSTRT